MTTSFGYANARQPATRESRERELFQLLRIADAHSGVFTKEQTAAHRQELTELIAAPSEKYAKQHCPLTPMQLAGAHLLLRDSGDELAAKMFAGAVSSPVRYPAA